jgi:hypothetical protein
VTLDALMLVPCGQHVGRCVAVPDAVDPIVEQQIYIVVPSAGTFGAKLGHALGRAIDGFSCPRFKRSDLTQRIVHMGIIA